MRPLLKSFVHAIWFLSSTATVYGAGNGGVYGMTPEMSGYSLISGFLGSKTPILPAQYRPTHSRPWASKSPRRGPEPGVGVGYVENCSVLGSNSPIVPRR